MADSCPLKLPIIKDWSATPRITFPELWVSAQKPPRPLIKNYGSLENFLEKGGVEKNYEKIVKSKDIALLSKKLAVIRRDAPLDVSELSELKYNGLSKIRRLAELKVISKNSGL